MVRVVHKHGFAHVVSCAFSLFKLLRMVVVDCAGRVEDLLLIGEENEDLVEMRMMRPLVVLVLQFVLVDFQRSALVLFLLLQNELASFGHIVKI